MRRNALFPRNLLCSVVQVEFRNVSFLDGVVDLLCSFDCIAEKRKGRWRFLPCVNAGCLRAVLTMSDFMPTTIKYKQPVKCSQCSNMTIEGIREYSEWGTPITEQPLCVSCARGLIKQYKLQFAQHFAARQAAHSSRDPKARH